MCIRDSADAPAYCSPVTPFEPGAYSSAWVLGIEHGQRYEFPPAFKGQLHTGVDLNRWDRQDLGAPVYAVADGIIRNVSDGDGGSTDIWVVIAHADGIDSRYGHLRQTNFQVPTRAVMRGDLIGWIGDGGGRFDPHLHWDMSKNEWLRNNPYHWVGFDDMHPDYIDPIAFVQNQV